MTTPWRVLLFDSETENPERLRVTALARALRDRPDIAHVTVAGPDDALPFAVRDRCNALIGVGGRDFDRGLWDRLVFVCGRDVLWADEDVEVGVPTVHLPPAACPHGHDRPIPDNDEGHYLYDVLCLDAASPERVAFLDALRPLLPGARCKFALDGAGVYRVPASERPRFAHRSRVVLSFATAFLPETVLAGGYPLIAASAGGLFPDVAGFSSVSECAEKIRYALAHEDERRAVARAAQECCRAAHLYRHRADALLRRLAAAPMPPPPAEEPRIWHLSPEASPPGALGDTAREALFARRLHDERIGIVVFAATRDALWSLPLVARSLGVPVVATFDESPVAASFPLAGGTASGKLAATVVPDDGRAFVAAVLENVDALVFPDEATRDGVLSAFPMLRRHPHVALNLADALKSRRIPHFGVEVPRTRPPAAWNVFRLSADAGGGDLAMAALTPLSWRQRLRDAVPYLKQHGLLRTARRAVSVLAATLRARLSRR